MEVDFSEYESNFCNYCFNRRSKKCVQCNAPKSYIGIPSCFDTTDKLAKQYFKVLSGYSKLLHCMGFEVRK